MPYIPHAAAYPTMYLRTTIMGALSIVCKGKGILSAPLPGLCKAGVYAELEYTIDSRERSLLSMSIPTRGEVYIRCSGVLDSEPRHTDHSYSSTRHFAGSSSFYAL